MTEFICGVQNTGKSTLIYERISADLSAGKKVILIVPDQEALSAEASLAEVCRDTPTYDLEVYGFSRLADDVFRTYGGVCYDYVDKTGAALALFLSICSVAPSLSVYKNVTAADRSLLSEMLGTIRGFKRQGVGPDDLENAANDAKTPPPLSKKLSDISKIYAAYEFTMKENGADPDDDTRRMYKILSENGGFKGYSVYIDSFISFTGVQMKVVELIMKTADKLTVAVGAAFDGGKTVAGSVLAPVYDTYKKLAAAARRYGDSERTELTRRYAPEELNALEAALRGDGGGCAGPCERIRVFSAKTCYEEADMIAADIRKRLMEGARCRDIAVITEDLQSRQGVIDAALEKYGVPYFMSVRTDVRQKPLFRFIQSAINVYTGNFRPEDVTAYVRSGMTGLPDRDTDLFTDYIRRYNVRKKENYSGAFTMISGKISSPKDGADEEKLARINAVREYVVTPLYDFCEKCGKALSAEEMTAAVTELIKEAGVPATVEKTIREAAARGDGDEAQETAQLWQVFVKVTEQIKTLCRDLPMRPSQYLTLLDTVLSQTTVGKIPTSIDEVTVGESGMLRAKGVRHVYVIGCNDGEFPSNVKDVGIIDDSEKEYLKAAGIETESGTEEATERKIYDFYRSACVASESVTFSYCRLGFDDADTEKRMCDVLSRTLETFGQVPVVTELPAEELCSAEQAAFEYYAEHADSDQGRALRAIFSEKEEYRQRLKALSEPITRPEETMSKKTVDALLPTDLTMSPTRLQTFIKCSIMHCCKYYLKLQSDKEIGFDTLDYGVLVHLILKKTVDDYIADRAIADKTGEELVSYTVGFIKEYCRTELGFDLDAKGFARLRALVVRLCESAAEAQREVLNEFEYGSFRPYKTELRIRQGAEVAPYAIPVGDGRTVKLFGQIDRVDVYRDGGKTYIKLVDYKTGKVKFKPSDVSEMENIQLFIYMIDAEKAEASFPSPVPAALYYMSTLPETKDAAKASELHKKNAIVRGGVALDDGKVKEALGAAVNTPDKMKADEREGKISLKSGEDLDGLFDTVKQGVAREVLKMAAGRIVPTEITGDDNPCKYCEFKAICRYTENKRKW